MEIHFSELDNNQNQSQNQSQNQNPYKNPEKYWETPQNVTQQKKKKVSFDDILSNMNIVVNKSGVLQFMQPLPSLQDEMYHQDQQYQDQQYQGQQYQGQQYQGQQYQQYQGQQQVPYANQPYQEYVAQQVAKKQQQQPLDPSVKNSFLYNKYFKDYKDAITPPEVRVPKTIEEYKKMLHDDRIQKIQQQKRIAEIKSTKLMFTSNDASTIQRQPPIRATKNNLRSMSFY